MELKVVQLHCSRGRGARSSVGEEISQELEDRYLPLVHEHIKIDMRRRALGGEVQVLKLLAGLELFPQVAIGARAQLALSLPGGYNAFGCVGCVWVDCQCRVRVSRSEHTVDGMEFSKGV